MKTNVEHSVRICPTCQRVKVDRHWQAGLLQPLPIPKHPWASMSMDFITGLLVVDGKGSFFIMVDHFSKYVIFLVASRHCPTEEVATLFLTSIVKNFRLPMDIIIDRALASPGDFRHHYSGRWALAKNFPLPTTRKWMADRGGEHDARRVPSALRHSQLKELGRTTRRSPIHA